MQTFLPASFTRQYYYYLEINECTRKYLKQKQKDYLKFWLLYHNFWILILSFIRRIGNDAWIELENTEFYLLYSSQLLNKYLLMTH